MTESHRLPETSSEDRMHLLDIHCWCNPRIERVHGQLSIVHNEPPFVIEPGMDWSETPYRVDPT